MFQTTKQIIQMSCASHSPWAPSAFDQIDQLLFVSGHPRFCRAAMVLPQLNGAFRKMPESMVCHIMYHIVYHQTWRLAGFLLALKSILEAITWTYLDHVIRSVLARWFLRFLALQGQFFMLKHLSIPSTRALLKGEQHTHPFKKENARKPCKSSW